MTHLWYRSYTTDTINCKRCGLEVTAAELLKYIQDPYMIQWEELCKQIELRVPSAYDACVSRNSNKESHSHDFVMYHGLRESYRYCTKCGEKEDK